MEFTKFVAKMWHKDFIKYNFIVKFWQTPDKIPSLWYTSGKVILEY